MHWFKVDFHGNRLFFFKTFQRSTFNLEKNSICWGKSFNLPHTNKGIYLLRNYFLNYVHLKDMYITLKGTGKILFISVLRILLIRKSLNFTTVLRSSHPDHSHKKRER